MRDLLRIRDVRLLLLGQAVSQAGDWLYDVALLVYVLDATGSAAWVAAAGMVRLLPWIFFAPLGGLVADRVDRRRILVACDLVQLAGMLGLMLVAAVNGSPEDRLAAFRTIRDELRRRIAALLAEHSVVTRSS